MEKHKLGSPLPVVSCHDVDWKSFTECLELDLLGWADVNVWHLGAVYQGLLEKQANVEKGVFSWVQQKAKARKSMGAYYTPPDLVDTLLKATLDPLVVGLEEAEILRFRLCDPACGTGYFLASAARRLATHLMVVRGESGEAAYLKALQDLVPHVVLGL